MPVAPAFELTGGHPALDFANTVDNRPTARRKELLNSYADFVAWSLQAGLVSSAQAARLARRAQSAPSRAQALLRRAIALREAFYEALSARAAQATPPPAALKRINSLLPAVLLRSRISRRGERFEWEFSGGAGDLDLPLWAAGQAMAELLTSEKLPLVRECAAGDCSWLFLDRSRNRSRRWCEMRVCGNRDKVRRFRMRSASSSAGSRS